MSNELHTGPGDLERISIDEAAKEILGEKLNKLIDDYLKAPETSLAESDEQPKAAIVMIRGRIYYLLSGSITWKKAAALLAGFGGLGWIIS